MAGEILSRRHRPFTLDLKVEKAESPLTRRYSQYVSVRLEDRSRRRVRGLH